MIREWVKCYVWARERNVNSINIKHILNDISFIFVFDVDNQRENIENYFGIMDDAII